MRKFLQTLTMAGAMLAASAPLSAADAPYTPSILVVENDEAVSELESQGVIVWHRRADMVLALVPNSTGTSAVSKVRGVRAVEPSRQRVLTLDKGRAYYDANLQVNGNGDKTRPYTGKGVVVGFVDSGFDPNHISFTDQEGNSRVRKLVCYNEPQGERIFMDTPEQLAAWSTDAMYYHATHVAGIMTGSYRGNDYYGMAPDAEIVGTTTQLYDMGMLSGCEEIIAYAKSVGKPCVINISVGSYNGPRDGSSLFNRYLDLLGEEAIICMSSGNEGNEKGGYRMDFSETNQKWGAGIWSKGNAMQLSGYTDIWSADERPVNIKLHVLDYTTGTSVYQTELLSDTEYFYHEIESTSDTEFGKYLNGYFVVQGYLNEDNNRWVTEMQFNTYSTAADANNTSRPRYTPAFEIYAEPGVHADVSTDMGNCLLRQWPGYAEPDNTMSISDLCTGENVISVGCYVTRLDVPLISGNVNTVGGENYMGATALFSSFGTLIDGRVLPHTVAPGYLISATNGPASEALGDELMSQMVSVQEEINGKKYYWYFATGTSMSSPFVAGTVAGWLEANPALTVADVKNLLSSTNLQPQAESSAMMGAMQKEGPRVGDPRNGQGFFRPYEGLKQIVVETGLNVGTIDAGAATAVYRGGIVEVLNPSGLPVTVRVYSTDGMEVYSEVVSESVANVNLGSLQRGTYVLTLASDGKSPRTMKFAR